MPEEIKETKDKSQSMPPSNEEYIESQNAIIKNRIDKMNAFRAEGIPVYDTGYQPDAHAADLKAKYGDCSMEELEDLVYEDYLEQLDERGSGHDH